MNRKKVVASLIEAAKMLVASTETVSSSRDIYAQVRDLPSVVQRALQSVGYRRRDIRIVPSEKFSRSNSPFEGNRGYNLYVNLNTNKFDHEIGSWGGANMFEDRGGDSDRTLRPIPPNILVIKGESGGRGSFATIYANPKTIAPLLPAGDEVSEDERKVLDVIGGIKSGYRKDEFYRKRLGPYSISNPLIQSLLDKGMLKSNKRGALMITTKGKNAR